MNDNTDSKSCQDKFHTLRDLEVKLAALEAKFTERYIATDKALSKAEDAINLRLEGMNEIRGALRDQQAQTLQVMLPRSEYAIQHTELERRLDVTVNRQQLIENKLTELAASVAGKEKGFTSISALIYSTIIAVAAIGSIIYIHIKMG